SSPSRAPTNQRARRGVGRSGLCCTVYESRFDTYVTPTPREDRDGSALQPLGGSARGGATALRANLRKIQRGGRWLHTRGSRAPKAGAGPAPAAHRQGPRRVRSPAVSSPVAADVPRLARCLLRLPSPQGRALREKDRTAMRGFLVAAIAASAPLVWCE